MSFGSVTLPFKISFIWIQKLVNRSTNAGDNAVDLLILTSFGRYLQRAKQMKIQIFFCAVLFHIGNFT